MGLSFKKFKRAVKKTYDKWRKDPLRIVTAAVSPAFGTLIGTHDIMSQKIDGENIYDDILNGWDVFKDAIPGIPIDIRHKFEDPISVDPIKIEPFSSEHTFRFGRALPPVQKGQGDFAASMVAFLAHSPFRMEQLRDFIEMAQNTLNGGNYINHDTDFLYVHVKLFPNATNSAPKRIQPRIHVRVNKAFEDLSDREQVFESHSTATLYPDRNAGIVAKEKHRLKMLKPKYNASGTELIDPNLEKWLLPETEDASAAQVRIPVNYRKILVDNGGFSRYSLSVEIDNVGAETDWKSKFDRVQIAVFRETPYSSQVLSFFDTDSFKGDTLNWLLPKGDSKKALGVSFPFDLRKYPVQHNNAYKVDHHDSFMCLKEETAALQDAGAEIDDIVRDFEATSLAAADTDAATNDVVRHLHAILKKEMHLHSKLIDVQENLRKRSRRAVTDRQDFRQNYGMRVINSRAKSVRLKTVKVSFVDGSTAELDTDNRGTIVFTDVTIPPGGRYTTTLYGPPPRDGNPTRMSVEIIGTKDGETDLASDSTDVIVELMTYVGLSEFIIDAETLMPPTAGDNPACTLEWVLDSVV